MNLLTDTWVVEGWLIGLPWVLLAVPVAMWMIWNEKLIFWKRSKESWHAAYKSAIEHCQKHEGTITRLRADRNGEFERAEKAEAEARELKAALDENERKWMARWTAKFPPPRPTSLLSNPPTLGKQPKKAIPKKKKAPKKKVKVSVAKKKKRA